MFTDSGPINDHVSACEREGSSKGFMPVCRFFAHSNLSQTTVVCAQNKSQRASHEIFSELVSAFSALIHLDCESPKGPCFCGPWYVSCTIRAFWHDLPPFKIIGEITIYHFNKAFASKSQLQLAKHALGNEVVFISIDLQTRIQVNSRMRRVSNHFSEEKNTGYYLETLWLGLRLYRGLFANSLGVKAPLFCGHKLTYNCNLRCKMCPFWKRSSADPSLEKEKAILKQIYDSGACGIAFEGGEPLLRNDLVNILAFSRSLPLHTSLSLMELSLNPE